MLNTLVVVIALRISAKCGLPSPVTRFSPQSLDASLSLISGRYSHCEELCEMERIRLAARAYLESANEGVLNPYEAVDNDERVSLPALRKGLSLGAQSLSIVSAATSFNSY